MLSVVALLWLLVAANALMPQSFQQRGSSRLFAEGEDLITNLFSRFLPKPEDIGLTRFTKESLPEKFPATKTEWASLLPSDADDANASLIRQTLKNTNLETRPLVLAYSAERDGWKASIFHSKVDRRGPGVVLCRTKSGGVLGGYNACGWVNLGESRGCIASFLFVFPGAFPGAPADLEARPIKLQKIAGASMAQLDDGGGPRFGAEGLTIPLEARTGVNAKRVLSKLGLYYENLPGGKRSILPNARAEDELVSLEVYVGDFGSDPIPYNDAMFFQLN